MNGIDKYLGELAGLATSVLWTGTSLLFSAAARRIGPVAVNATRLALAVILHYATFRAWSGDAWPDARSMQTVYLAASGLLGLTIGDQALITSFLYIGPRLGVLLMITAPLWAALFGWVALGETLPPAAWFGVLLTIGGVAWVVLERPTGAAVVSREHRLRGFALALLAAACQAAGLMLSKRGMGHGWLPVEQHLPPQSATLIRMFFATLFMIPIIAHRARRGRAARMAPESELPPGQPGRGAGVMFACAGAIVGPYLGVWMSLVASDRAPLGVAQTLCSLPPVFILPLAALLYGERITPRAVIGALAAIGGAALLFVRPAL